MVADRGSSHQIVANVDGGVGGRRGSGERSDCRSKTPNMVRAQGRVATTTRLCRITPSISFLISYYSLTVDDAAYGVFEAKIVCLGCAKVSDGGEQTERRKGQ